MRKLLESDELQSTHKAVMSNTDNALEGALWIRRDTGSFLAWSSACTAQRKVLWCFAFPARLLSSIDKSQTQRLVRVLFVVAFVCVCHAFICKCNAFAGKISSRTSRHRSRLFLMRFAAQVRIERS